MQSTQDPCSVDDCDLSVKRRSLCYRHYMRWWRYGDPLLVPSRRRIDLAGKRFGSLTVVSPCEGGLWLCRCDCGVDKLARTADLRRGSILSCGALKHQRQAVVGYGAAHERLYVDRGPASDHACVDCGGAAAQWSYDHGDPDELLALAIKGAPAFSLKAEHYQPRCVPCHKTFDLAIVATV